MDYMEDINVGDNKSRRVWQICVSPQNKSKLEKEGLVRMDVLIKEDIKEKVDQFMRDINQKEITTYYPTITRSRSKCFDIVCVQSM